MTRSTPRAIWLGIMLLAAGCAAEDAPSRTELQAGQYSFTRSTPGYGRFSVARDGSVEACRGYVLARCAGAIERPESDELTAALESANALFHPDQWADRSRILAEYGDHTLCTTTDELAHCFRYQDWPRIADLDRILQIELHITQRLVDTGACGSDTCAP